MEVVTPSLLLDGSPNFLMQTDGSGNLGWIDPTTLGADNLGNHSATMNLLMGNNWITNDGDPEGLSVETDGTVLLNQDGLFTAMLKFKNNNIYITGNNANSGDMRLATGAVDRIQITGGGQVGIGIINPTQLLQVNNGNLLISNTTNTAGGLRFAEPSASGANYTAFRAQAQTADITYTLPSNIGNAGDVLSNNGTGILSWIDPSSLG
jgi:hypothetical protein